MIAGIIAEKIKVLNSGIRINWYCKLKNREIDCASLYESTENSR
jgi:hypothetical protein